MSLMEEQSLNSSKEESSGRKSAREKSLQFEEQSQSQILQGSSQVLRKREREFLLQNSLRNSLSKPHLPNSSATLREKSPTRH